MESKKILIVEDDKMLCKIFEMFIRDTKHELIGFFKNGQDAIKKCKEIKPDVIIMDIHIEGEINGIETSKIIYEEFNIPIIYLTSDIERETIKSAINLSTYGFLVKPTNRIELGIAIQYAYYRHKFDNATINNIKH